MCRINPRVDFAFKKLFGSEENKDLLISLINAIISPTDQITEIELKNPYSLANYCAGKMSIMDIKARDKTDKWFNVEMQISEDFYYDKRAIYYWAKLVAEQLGDGMKYRELKKTFSINILDFDLIPDPDTFHNLYNILNVKTGQADTLHDVFEMHYVELSKFKKAYHEIATTLDRWTTFLTRAHELDKNNVPIELAVDKEIVKAIEVVDRLFDDDERQIYETRMQALADVESQISSAWDKGWLEGREEGIEAGIEKEKLNLARSLLDILDVETIALKTGLSQKEIEQLK
ncbi:MAG: Rpn family recombination-promoting nuclease/putative transposase [Candidatus Parabeggiatoa sp.]|nr:Rpn family recombination-promoting nuclease/putative transposase [Candidatus Parabeggiatoa sp.]